MQLLQLSKDLFVRPSDAKTLNRVFLKQNSNVTSVHQIRGVFFTTMPRAGQNVRNISSK